MATRASNHRKLGNMPKAGSVNLRLLPPQLRLLVRCIGEGPAFKLVCARGGTVVQVPVKAQPDHPLCDLLGLHAFGLLVAEYGSQRLELTKADSLIRQVRHKQALEMAEAGCSLNEIALSCNYTRRHVINVLGELAEMHGHKPEQLDMFAQAEAAEHSRDTAAHNPFHLVPQ